MAYHIHDGISFCGFDLRCRCRCMYPDHTIHVIHRSGNRHTVMDYHGCCQGCGFRESLGYPALVGDDDHIGHYSNRMAKA